MKTLVEEKGIQDRVRFVGRLTDRQRLKLYYAAADLFLFPSLYDTDGLVVREAAALHTPAIMLREASAAGMLSDGQTGFLIGNSADDFEAAIRSLAADRGRLESVGLRASNSIVRSWKDIAEEAIDRYNSLIQRVKLIQPIGR
jgi:glycosyltransferase involved in cell wall biosynthesis